MVLRGEDARVKIDRLIGILSILLQKGTVTAPYLAEKFEVSRRTINRDIEDLCMAGIPIATRQGAGGGISIMDGYAMSRTVLTAPEMRDILAGLRSLDSVNGTNRYRTLMEKLSVGSSDFLSGDQSVLIDLSSWYKSSLAPKIQTIRDAIDACRVLSFTYYSPYGETQRAVEPYYLIFRWGSWYLWGWCRSKEDFRLFKLNRLEDLSMSSDVFEKRDAPLPDLGDERVFPANIHVVALFDPDCKWRLVEEYSSGCFTVQPDGKLLFTQDFTNAENLITWLLGFRDKVRLIEPVALRRELHDALIGAAKQYEEDNDI